MRDILYQRLSELLRDEIARLLAIKDAPTWKISKNLIMEFLPNRQTHLEKDPAVSIGEPVESWYGFSIVDPLEAISFGDDDDAHLDTTALNVSDEESNALFVGCVHDYLVARFIEIFNHK